MMISASRWDCGHHHGWQATRIVRIAAEHAKRSQLNTSHDTWPPGPPPAARFSFLANSRSAQVDTGLEDVIDAPINRAAARYSAGPPDTATTLVGSFDSRIRLTASRPSKPGIRAGSDPASRTLINSQLSYHLATDGISHAFSPGEDEIRSCLSTELSRNATV
jgi:hypothetical protein